MLKRLPSGSNRKQHEFLRGITESINRHPGKSIFDVLGGHGGFSPVTRGIGDLGFVTHPNSTPNWVLARRMHRIEARKPGIKCMFCLILEVGEGGLKVGLEGRKVGVEEGKAGEVVEEIGAMVLEVGEGLLEAELGWIVCRW
ncbi:hypothetical protein ACFX16_032692 [Malus domestica]